ncbi:MAG: hypothetical protein ACKVP0_06495 [Pirellulaceae bacterium]
MSRSEGGAAVTLSIDLELAIGRQTSQGQDRLAIVTAELVELLDHHGIAATWGVSNPALSAARDAILAAKTRQEVAVLGERFWLGDGTTPSRLAQEFERRFVGARQDRPKATTLLLRHSAEHLDLNLLLGHGITAVRGPAVAATVDKGPTRSGNMRFGIWQVESPILVPLAGSWWQTEPWAFRQRLNTAVQAGTPLNLVLDAGRMAELSDLGLAAVGPVLQCLGDLQKSRQLCLVTLGELATKHLRRRASQPSRSVLAA